MKTVAISAGHTAGRGAVSHNGVEEHRWNSAVVCALRVELERRGFRVVVLHRDPSLGYTSAMRKLGREMRAEGADCALELHFNSATPRANGFEFLHWWGSGSGKGLALALGGAFGRRFPRIVARGDRGARSLWFHRWNDHKGYSGRGGGYVFLTPCPAVVCEPGFASNTSDWAQLEKEAGKVAKAYADGVEDFLL